MIDLLSGWELWHLSHSSWKSAIHLISWVRWIPFFSVEVNSVSCNLFFSCRAVTQTGARQPLLCGEEIQIRDLQCIPSSDKILHAFFPPPTHIKKLKHIKVIGCFFRDINIPVFLLVVSSVVCQRAVCSSRISSRACTWWLGVMECVVGVFEDMWSWCPECWKRLR